MILAARGTSIVARRSLLDEERGGVHLGVRQATVSKIELGKRWSHIPKPVPHLPHPPPDVFHDPNDPLPGEWGEDDPDAPVE